MTTSWVQLTTDGTGKYVATNTFPEDAVTKHVQRFVLCNSAGTELNTTNTPIYSYAIGSGAYATTASILGTLPTTTTANIIGVVQTTASILGTLPTTTTASILGTPTVYVFNTAGLVVNVANTGGVSIISGSAYLVNTAGWIVNVANTGGSVALIGGSALIGTMNTVAIGAGSTVSVVNSAGWVVGLGAGTALAGTMNTIAIGAGSTVSVVNSAGWVISVANTGGSVGLIGGSALIGTMNTVAIGAGSTVSIVNSSGWLISVLNTGGAVSLSGGSALAGTMNTIAIGAGSTVSVVNSAGWVISVANTGGTSATTSSIVSIAKGFGYPLKYYTNTLSNTTDVVAAVAGSGVYVTAYSLITTSQTLVTLTFQDNASTALWTVPLQAISGAVSGANLATTPPAYLFYTAVSDKLTLAFGSSNAVTVSLTYFQV